MLKLNVKRIELERRRQGWTYTDVAREAEISKQLLHHCIKNETLSQAGRIAKAFGLDGKDLIIESPE